MEEPDSDPHLWLVHILINTLTGNFSLGILVSVIVILILIIISALISGSEVSFFSLNPAQVNYIASKESRLSKIILLLLEKPKRLLATILIANNFINVGIVILSAFVSGELFDFSKYPVMGFLIEVIIIAVILLLFGEIMPKIYATQKPVNFAFRMARPLYGLTKVFYPLSSLLVRTTNIIDNRIAKKGQGISMSDLSDAIDITVDDDAPEEETKILKGIVKFTDIEVKEIMKSRVDVTAIDKEISFMELMEIVIESGYSRIPVFEETLDNIKGILYVKDLLPHLNKKGNFDWFSLLRAAFFIPENKKINDLLHEFQEKKIHLAIVVDEYGGTSGIITLEDIIEEIVGEITDEFDSPGEGIDYSKLDDNNYIFEGKTSINDFCKIIGIDDNFFDEVKGDSDSLAGIILELQGEIPKKDTSITYQNFDFKILTVDKRRIKKIKITIKDKEYLPSA